MRGYSLIEIVMVIAILAVLAILTVGVYSRYNSSQGLDKDTALVVSLLNQARTLTLSSKVNSQYGLHLDSSQVTLFTGSTYAVGSSSNIVYPLNRSVSLSSTLSPSSTNVVFERLTGKATYYGTITLSSLVDSSSTKSITIYSTGAIEN